MKIPQHILFILGAADVSGNALRLNGQLDRKSYVETDKILSALGGKWSRKHRAHIFEIDIEELLDEVVTTGEFRNLKKDFGQFDTPQPLSSMVVDLADVHPGMTALEPSAGLGNIAVELIDCGAEVTIWEIDRVRAAKLTKRVCDLNVPAARKATGVVSDFLEGVPYPLFDRVVMNPPFAKMADIAHVEHALRFLKPDGLLVAIMSPSFILRTASRAAAFRQNIEKMHGLWKELPSNSFASVGTGVNAVVLRVYKDGREQRGW